MNDAPYNSAIADNAFATVRDDDIPWQESDSGLPPGVLSKRLHVDPVMRRRVSKVRFPPGFMEPRHTHKGWHCVLVLKGRMCVDGKELLPGDFVFGWDIPHGPFEYPDGAEVYTVAIGDIHHEWDWDEFLALPRRWAPTTEEGREGCARFDAWRREEARKRAAAKAARPSG